MPLPHKQTGRKQTRNKEYANGQFVLGQYFFFHLARLDRSLRKVFDIRERTPNFTIQTSFVCYSMLEKIEGLLRDLEDISMMDRVQGLFKTVRTL